MHSIGKRGFAVATSLIAVAIITCAQGRYDNARGLVSRVQNDLRRAERFTPPSEKERERYHNPQHHLSEFDQKLSEGQFDKGKLDQAIDDVKNVVENNTLSPTDRDVLSRGLRDLRELRRTRGAPY